MGKKRVKIVEIRVMLKLVLILALVAAALSAPLGEVPRRPNPLAIHRTRGFYQGLLFLDLGTRAGVLEQNVSQKDPCDTSFGTGQGRQSDESDESDKKIDKADESVYTAYQKTRQYYQGLSPQQKEEFWSRVRSGNKADEESYKHQMSIG